MRRCSKLSLLFCLALHAQNHDSRTKTVKVRPPKSKYFGLTGFFTAQSLAPGLETQFEVSRAEREGREEG